MLVTVFLGPSTTRCLGSAGEILDYLEVVYVLEQRAHSTMDWFRPLNIEVHLHWPSTICASF